ncbi:MAG: DUF4388 domain-containing protein [Myxococcota bacterium]
MSLARKSGRLVLRTDGEAGWILLCDGQVRGAAIKGRSDDLRGLLVSSGELSEEAFDGAREAASEAGIGVDAAIVERGDLTLERLDGLRRQCVERSVMDMFLWRTGEFSFEVREEVGGQDEELLLTSGINTQYLAMEATRLRDEGELLGPAPGAMSDEEPLFSGEEPEEPEVSEASGEPEASPEPEASALDAPGDDVEDLSLPVPVDPEAVEAMALASARGVEDDEADEADDTDPDHTLSDANGEAAAVATDIAVEESPAAAPVEVQVCVEETGPREQPPVVALDRDLVALEWLKAQAVERFPRVHIFQRSELGMDRVRRYLARGVVPLVLATPQMLRDEDDGRDLLERLRSLSPEMAVFALLTDRDTGRPADVDGCVTRPAAPGSDPDGWAAYVGQAEALLDALGSASPTASRRSPGRPDAALERLRSVSDRLRDPERRDDVLTVVLEFAARNLSRVAVFMLRDDELMGMAERGLSRAGGPDGDAVREIQLTHDALPALFRRALEARRGVRGPLSPTEDAELVERLGGSAPHEAYAAPIESGGSPVALVYGDNLPVDAPIGDTTALEIVLHEAGLALDRASLELALAAAQTAD